MTSTVQIPFQNKSFNITQAYSGVESSQLPMIDWFFYLSILDMRPYVYCAQLCHCSHWYLKILFEPFFCC